MLREPLDEAVVLLCASACSNAKVVPPRPCLNALNECADELLGEEYFTFPVLTNDGIASLDLEKAHELRAYLGRVQHILDDRGRLFTLGGEAVESVLVEILAHMPYDFTPPDEEDTDTDLTFDISVKDIVQNPAHIVECIIVAFFARRLIEEGLFHDMRLQLEHNICVASGIVWDTRWDGKKNPVMPSRHPVKPSTELFNLYLAHTPFQRFFNAAAQVAISLHTRFEHTHILGGTGHGKTQLLQYMIHHDLERAEEGGLSVVVVDSQGDLIRKLSRLKLFVGPLAERLVIIDPADIEHPPALNLFDAGLDRLDSYTPHQRELAFNSLVDIYGRFFGSLLGAELTAKQGAVFRYLARLMLTIKGATIHTMIELMDSVKPFEGHIKKLDPTAKRFFENEFSRPGFNATRQQIKQRLYTVLSIPTFDRLFSAPKSKVNFFDVLNEGSIVLVSTAKDLLKTDGAAIFGRFVLSLIEHAIMERATLQEHERTPTLLYVDEAQDYFDETIETLLVQGRKQRFGLIMAHQNLAQTSSRLNAVLAANTTIKFAGGISDKDARALASDMRTSVDMLLSMRKRADQTEFALSVRNQTPHALKTDIPLGFLEGVDVMSAEDHAALLEKKPGAGGIRAEAATGFE